MKPRESHPSDESAARVQNGLRQAIRKKAVELGRGVEPEAVVALLAEEGIVATVADVNAVKAEVFLASEPNAGEPASKAWVERDQMSETTLAEAQKLVDTAGSVDRAKHALDVLEDREEDDLAR